ncbi:beta-N-acetylhexosaminidase [Chryseobacterium piperi]|uniref:beta-N-acetylhexosaminidase n=1 Tax=Chryseobacterium piperi TaxID=558152 RepID=UPI000550100D|nr:beta-N-acetylhexosaminidase [Chryseobacterium piperi]ASW73589.1 beta-N-acetylhexosaminidase [Chryseobacterium piperi]
MKKNLIILMLVWINLATLSAQQVSIIPQPEKLDVKTGTFRITPETKIVTESGELSKSAAFLNSYLKEYYGFSLGTAKKSQSKNIILLQEKAVKESVEGTYQLKVENDRIVITGNDKTGVFYGIQSLIQLLPVQASKVLNVPQVEISDAPRFSYRGLMLDVSRHFFSIDFIKKYIDFIALHKMNTFHWHLTDDQGWRIEIKKYPKLTQVGGCRDATIIGHHPGKASDNQRNCGYYTQEQVKEIVQYAADRYITVIPEIEMPGHASAAIAAYPELSCFPQESTYSTIKQDIPWGPSKEGKQVVQAWGVYKDVFCPSEYTFGFLENVLDEVISLFPSKYIHIGGDECPKDFWKRSDFCQKLIKEKNLKDEHELQSYFIQRIEKHLNSKGREIIGWDEILEGGLAPNATVMSWRGEKGGVEAAKKQHKVIMTPTTYAYLDYAQKKNEDSLVIGGFLPLEKVYGYEPLSKELNLSVEEQKYIIGGQANVWTEYMSTPKKVEYMIFPRLSAISEVLWSQPEHKNFEDFSKRLKIQAQRYDLWKSAYCKDCIDKANEK